jgi:hypothetical protein
MNKHSETQERTTKKGNAVAPDDFFLVPGLVSEIQ